MDTPDYSYPKYAKILHMGLAVFGIAAYLTGENADSGADSTAYLLHAYLGLSLTLFWLARLLPGLFGKGPLNFSGWSPLSVRQWAMAWEDIKTLARLRVPSRGMHEGIAGLTQSFGLILFGLMGVTGTGLFFLAGGPESDFFEGLEEVHELGEVLIPLYLALHVGSVVVHLVAGEPIWKRMWKFSRSRP